MSIKEKIEKLKETIEYHNHRYHVLDDPEIEDEVFDQLIKELIQLEEQHPEFTTSDSPTQKVGAPLTNTFEAVKHKIPMLSLSKQHNMNEFDKWLGDNISEGVTEFFGEFKMDGLAVDLEYINGDLVQGATRGDGIVGDNVTATVYAISSIPKRLVSNITGPFTGHIRGEVYLKKSKLEEINKVRASQGLKEFKNVRNAAAGILKRKEVTKENSYLDFGAYGFEADRGEHNPKTYAEMTSDLVDLGVPVVAELGNFIININKMGKEDAIKSAEDFILKTQEVRDQLDFDIDGVVIKANNFADQKRLGSKVNVPNWATAYKFPAMRAVTTLLGIEWTMGNKGNITPNARIEPVELMGVTVKNITLHNLEELKRLGIMIGDKIVISRRGDVIPKVESVLTELRTGNEITIEIPIECPSCSNPTSVSGAYLRCSAGDNCNFMDFAKIQNFVVALDIEGFGPKVIEKILEEGFVQDLADIFDLTVDQLSGIERMGKRSATKLVNNIQAAKDAPYHRILTGLTIPNVGTETGKDIIEKFGNLLNFVEYATYQDLVEIQGIGDKVATNIVNWLIKKQNKELLLKLIAKGVGKEEVKTLSSNKLEGKSFCFTGKLSQSREYYENLVVENGGELLAVKKGLTYLVAGEKAGSKLEKAGQLGVEVIDETTFMNMIL